MNILMYLGLFSGLLLMVLSVPMILGIIPPNGLYGFRVKKTMENPDIWYPANTYSGKWLLVAGAIMVLASIGLHYIPGLSLDNYAYALLIVWVVVFSIALIASLRYLKSL